MSRRSRMRVFALLAFPIALFAATPAVQWCEGVALPLTRAQLAACIASEAICRVSESPASSMPGACESTGSGACEGERCPFAGRSAPDAPVAPSAADRPAHSAPTPGSKTFCVGSPAGGFGLRPAFDAGDAPDAAIPAPETPDVAPPTAVAFRWPASPGPGPPGNPAAATPPIRGPPST